VTLIRPRQGGQTEPEQIPRHPTVNVLHYWRVEIHRSARSHGVSDDDIRHAVDHPLVVSDFDPDADPPKILVIGPDAGGNLLEVIVLVLADDEELAIHAMPLRRRYFPLLEGNPDDREEDIQDEDRQGPD
jgi:hypothetical protein